MHIRRPIPWLLMGLSKKIQTNAKNEKYRGLAALLCKEGKAEVHVRTT